MLYNGQTAQNIIHVSTDDGDVEITEDDLALVTDEDLQKLRMSRDVLYRCFAEGVVLMQRKRKDPKVVRPCADETTDGRWIVKLVHYSPITRPKD